ncbi:MAG: DUF5979 domain-containing protein [Saccharofermentans sp.]|nr:DUF5979 domain-containing protein [Saccharofermentans sp.]
MSKDTRVIASAVEEGKAVPANLDSISAINYATILGRATDFGIVANDFEQITHMETTFAVNTFSNTSGQVNEVDFIPNTAQFMIGEIVSGKVKFGQNQTASSYVIESTDAVFDNFDSEWQSGEIFQDSDDVNSSNFYFDNAGRIWTGEGSRPVYTISKDQDDINTNINDVIGNATAASDYISTRATDPAYALDYTQYLTIDNINRAPYDPQDPNTGNPDQGNRFYIDIDKSEFVNRVVYINVDQNLARVMANSEGLCIIKDPSTVVVFNIEPGITSGQNGGLVLNRMCVSEDGGRNFCNTVTSSQGRANVSNSNSSGLGTENNVDFYNSDVDRMVNQKVILNIRSDYDNIELNAVGGTVLIPDPDAHANVKGSSSGWVVSGGHLRNDGGEWHYIYQGGSQELINITNGQQIHFALHKDFTTDNGTTVDNTIYMAPDQFTFNFYDLGTGLDYNSIDLNSINGITPVTATNQGTGNVFFPSMTLSEPGDYYYLINEANAGSSDGEITNTDGYIKIHVNVAAGSPSNTYTVDYAYYLHANDAQPVRHEENVGMMGVQCDLGSFFNKVETTGTLELNKTVLGVTASEAHDTYVFNVKSGNRYYGMDVNGNLLVSSSPIACEVHPGVPFVIRDLPLDQTYTVTESRNGIDIAHYDCTVSGEGSVTLSSANKSGSINITNSYSGRLETGSIYIAKFGSDTNGSFLGGAQFTLTTENAHPNGIGFTGATNVDVKDIQEIKFTTVGTEAVHIEGLTEGTYTLTEINAPEGYNAVDPVTFSINRYGVVSYGSSVDNVSYNSTTNVLTIVDQKDEPVPVTATVDISKKDTVAGEELPGAQITITSNDNIDLSSCVVTGGGSNITVSGNVISFISGDVPTTIEGLPVGTYTMHEITAPDGYQVATDIEFTVGDDGSVTGSSISTSTATGNAVVTMLDAPSAVDISKVSVANSDYIPGAVLWLTCEDRSVDLTRATVTGADDVEKTSSKITFTSGNGVATFTGLPDGTYTLHEEIAPNVNGVQYVVATDINFTIANGQVLSGSNVTVASNGNNAVVTMVDDIFVPVTGTVDISKRDTVAGNELPGAQITITGPAGSDLTGCVVSGGGTNVSKTGNTISFVSGSTPTTIEGLPAGTYTMHEVAAPAGFVTATDIEFTVGDDGSISGSAVTASSATGNAVVTMLDAPTTVDISKKDTVAGNELPGAQITVTGPAGADLTSCTVTGGATGISVIGNEISFTSGNSATTIQGLPAGTYTMHEVAAPSGYRVATDIEFTVGSDGTITGSNITTSYATGNAVVTMLDAPTVVDISKVETGAGDELPGAELQITEVTGSVDLTVASVSGGAQNVDITSSVISFTSGTSKATITGLPNGTYILHEETAPNINGVQYAVATDIRFSIVAGEVQQGTNITVATDNSNAVVTMEDDVIVNTVTGATVDISKVAVGGSSELPGAQLWITCADDRTDLSVATVSGGAQNAVVTSSKISFTSGDSVTTISNLPDGEYTLHEEVAPNVNGVQYDVATDIRFVVSNGVVQPGNNVTTSSTSNAVVTMEDAVLVTPPSTSTVAISKRNTGNEELPGAELLLTGPASADLSGCTVTGGGSNISISGNTISFTSGSSATEISGLPNGDYVLVETVAPNVNGVQYLTTTISFNVTDGVVTTNSTNARVESNGNVPVVVMVDDAVPVNTGCSLIISKQVAANGASVPSVFTFNVKIGDTYYGLDDQGNLISDVNPIAISIASGSSVQLDGLPNGDYEVTEVRSGIEVAGYSLTVTGERTVSLNDADPSTATATVSVVNTYNPLPGSLTIIKDLGAGAPASASSMVYTFSVVGPNGYTNEVSVTGAGSVTIDNLQPGTYTVTEDTTSAYISGYQLTANGNGVNVNVTAGNASTVTVTNDYEATTAATSEETTAATEATTQPSAEATVATTTTTEATTTTTVLVASMDVSISKQDIAGAEIDGAVLTITNAAGNTTDFLAAGVTATQNGQTATGLEVTSDHLTFTTVSSSQALIHDLPVGHYVLTETIAPRGYLIAESISFEVRNDGTIWVAGTPSDQMVDRIVMQDLADPTYGTTQDDTSVLGVRRDAPAEETTTTTTTTPTEASSGSVTRTGETAVSATAIVAVVLLIAGGSVLVLRRKFEA